MSEVTRKGLGVFVREDGSITSALMFLLLSSALWIGGQSKWALVSLLVVLVLVLCTITQDIDEEDKQEIRFNVIHAHDVLQEMVDWELLLNRTLSTHPENSPEVDNHRQKARVVVGLGLLALAKKYGKVRKGEPQDDLALWCQQAAYIGFRTFPQDDSIVAASVSLLALVAKDERVKERHLVSADEYGLNTPLQCLHDALRRAKDYNDPTVEQQSAELQRKGCLLLGALSSSSDGKSDIASLTVQEGGLEVILNALDWFRFHVEVANWGLWAIFTLCYENYPNKIALVQTNGIPRILRIMRNCSDSVEVARHGTAILFDLLREDDDQPANSKLDIWKMRKLALDSGLHEVIIEVMGSFLIEMDVMMMGQEILVGTDYQGDIPQFHPT